MGDELKRYDIIPEDLYGRTIEEQSIVGDWVKYEDVKTLEARVAELELMIERTIWFVNYKTGDELRDELKKHLKRYADLTQDTEKEQS